jgi:hypothetical protein
VSRCLQTAHSHRPKGYIMEDSCGSATQLIGDFGIVASEDNQIG